MNQDHELFKIVNDTSNIPNNTYKPSHPHTKEYMLFSVAQYTVFSVKHILAHKASTNNKKSEIASAFYLTLTE